MSEGETNMGCLVIPPMRREPMVSALEVVPWDGATESLVDSLVSDIAMGIRVLRTRDGVWITEDQVLDRARNIAQGLIGNYRILRSAP